MKHVEVHRYLYNTFFLVVHAYHKTCIRMMYKVHLKNRIHSYSNFYVWLSNAVVCSEQFFNVDAESSTKAVSLVEPSGGRY